MSNALFIGLGGTGIKTLLLIKQQLMGRNPDDSIEDGIEFLGIDTDRYHPSIPGVYDPNATINEESTISLDHEEFIYLGGYLGDFVHYVDNVQLDWFAKDWYLVHPFRQRLLNINEPASMHRQVGRLALFKMLETGAWNSNLYCILNEKLQHVIENSIAKVLIFGSLAGGTGASMINDIPLILQDIAYRNFNAVIKAYGFFALPDAFEHGPNVSVDGEMRARALAALREMIRFNNRQIDLSMSYDAQGTIQVDVSNAPYEIMFLCDKKGTPQAGTAIQNPLDVDIAYGVCPTMASFAWVFADDNSILGMASHLSHRVAEIGVLSGSYSGYNPPVCSSFGSFSYVLPLGAIVEDWTCQFARDLLGVLVPVDYNGRILTNQKGGEYSNAGNVEVSPIMLDALRDFEPLVRDVVEIGESEKAKANDKSTISNICTTKMMDRKVSQWQDRFKLPPPSQETIVEAAERVKAAIIFERMREDKTYYCHIRKNLFGKEVAVVDEGALVPLVDAGDYGGDPYHAGVRLINDCEVAYEKEETTWENAFSARRKKILYAYRTWLKYFAQETLNGDAQNAAFAEAAKSGKLGWLWDFVRELVARMHALENVLVRANHVYDVRRMEILHTYDVDALKLNLKNKPNGKNQKQYLMYQQRLLEQNRLQFLCQQELELIRSMREFTETLLQSLRDYLRMLCDGEDFTLQSSLSDQQATIAANRLHSQERFDRVREYINDPDWETSKYREYLHNDNPEDLPMNLVLQDVKWEVKETTQQGRQERDDQQALSVELHIEGFERQAQGDLRFNILNPLDPAELISDEEKINLLSSNLNRLKARCRKVFQGVWGRISVMDYLFDKWNGESPHSRQDFAERMASKIDVVLEGARNNVTEKVFYLHPVTNNLNHINWANVIYTHLQNLMGAAQNNHAAIDHQDPTTFTVLKMVDFIKISDTACWRRALGDYLSQSATMEPSPQPSRPLLHVFKEEQLACRYENDGTGLLHPAIVELFREPKNISLFVSALIWGFIKLDKIESAETNQDFHNDVYLLEIEPAEGELDAFYNPLTEPHKVYLGRLDSFFSGGVIPPLYVAARKFCLLKEPLGASPVNSRLHSMQDYLTYLETAIHLRIEMEVSALLKEWRKTPPEFDHLETQIYNLPEGQTKMEALSNYVLWKAYQPWCQSPDGESNLEKLLRRFHEARTVYDVQNYLQYAAEIEEQFVKFVLAPVISQQFQFYALNLLPYRDHNAS